MAAALLTTGHGTASREQLGGRLQSAAVRSLVDIRIGPGSRRNPHLARAELESWLPAYGVQYRWERRLGGFRHLPADPPSPDTALRNTSFRAYAGYMRSADFVTAIEGVAVQAADACTVVMCSESVWWRCHRRLVADYAELVLGLPVEHLMPDGRLAPHRLTDGVRRADGGLVYDAS